MNPHCPRRHRRGVGKERLLEILQSDLYHLYDPDVNGGLWIGKEYGKSSAYKRDPLHNLSHGATPMQAARFYYLLETGQLCNPKLTAEMKDMLGNPGINHKFVVQKPDLRVRFIYVPGTCNACRLLPDIVAGW